MADDNTIIEGSVKFRDGKKWKSRWCVMRKLSPAADCVHLQVYRDSKARWAGAGGCKAALSLQHFLGSEAGFTLDKHSNTLALLCADLVAVLAFETRERLMQWQVKVNSHVGTARQYLVLVAGAGVGVGLGTGAGAAGGTGPARLHVRARRLALAAGAPPRLLGVWELAHLRRYGVVEGRFCFEGGSRCGKGEGLHVLVTDQAEEIAADCELAAQGRLSPRRRPHDMKRNDGFHSPKSHKTFRPDARLSELNTIELSLPPLESRLYEEHFGEERAASPCWPAMEHSAEELGLGDTASVRGEGAGGSALALQRCTSCMSKLGALSRSSTAALTPGAKHFSPAWTMDALHETYSEANTRTRLDGGTSSAIDETENLCRCPSVERTPGRPPKPTRLELNLNRKPRMPLPSHSCSCSRTHVEENKCRVGPYENYDVPKLASSEVDGDYYDTPKRLKECLNNELFQITKSSTPNAVILKKPCGCLLKFGRRRKEPTVIESDELTQPATCPCRRVTDWANSWIKLPYTRKNTVSSDNLAQNTENFESNGALYATIDLSRKTRRKTHPIEPDECGRVHSRSVEVDEGPLANYENLNFALSLEYYENAKDLLRRAGVTQSELDAISANLIPPALPAKLERSACRRCGNPPAGSAGDDYLMMEPKSLESGMLGQGRPPLASAGYTPMSPIGGFAFEAPARPARSPRVRPRGERSASSPTLCAPPRAAAETRKRSSSADSMRFLEDVKELEGGCDSSSSLETLRDRRGGAGVEAGAGAGGVVPRAPGNRDSSSSNDSGVSSWSRRAALVAPPAPRGAAPPRRSRSSGPVPGGARLLGADKCSSAEAEVPVLSVRSLRGVVDSHSTSSGASDMSDYIETLSICSSHSSTDTPITMRVRGATSSLRPRSGKEYLQLAPRPHLLYSNLP